MTEKQLLSAEAHGHLRVAKNTLDKRVERNTSCPITDAEIFAAAGCFPIVLMKADDTNEFVLSAIFCLQAQRNNFFLQGQWLAPYVPLSIRREPLSLLVYEADEPGAFRPVVDMSSELLSQSDGAPLFTSSGQPTTVLMNKLHILETINQGQESTRSLIAHLLRLNLIKQLKIKLSYRDKVHWVSGIYGIDIHALHQGDQDLVTELAGLGILENCLMMKASLLQLGRLVWMENQQSDGAIEDYAIVV